MSPIIMSPIIAGLLAACGNNRYVAVPSPTPPGPQEPPTINLPAISAGSRPENTEIAASDTIFTSQFSGTGVTFALQQNQGDASLFSINSTTGIVTFSAATTPNYEVKDSYNFTVEATVTDADNVVLGLLRQAVQLGVENLQEAGSTLVISGTVQVAQTLIASEVTDPDDVTGTNTTGSVTESWQWQVSSDGSQLQFSDFEIREKLVLGGTGKDALDGTDFNELLKGYAGDDVINAGGGNDVIRDIDGDNELYGDAGADVVHGSGKLYGGSGHDNLYGRGGSGGNPLYGGDGIDWLDVKQQCQQFTLERRQRE